MRSSSLQKISSKQRVLRLEPLESRMLLSVDCSTSSISSGILTTTQAAQLIGLDEVLADYGFTGSGQTVVVIDSGIDYNHEAFLNADGTSRVVGGYDFAEKDTNPFDDGTAGGHGTHVSGILAGNSKKLTGVASDADIVSLRVVDDNGNCKFEWVEDALQWVLDNLNSFKNPITTINISLGDALNNQSVPNWAVLEDEFAALAAKGVFISVAAGNAFATYQTTGLCYPAVSSSVVAVASIDASGSMSYFSQRDVGVIAAPGRSVLSSVPDYFGDNDGLEDDYAAMSGTSMASPIVAGASMLLREAYAYIGVTNVSEATLYNTLIATADTVYDSVTNAYYYVLDIDAAIDSIMPADDIGSTVSGAKGLGAVSNSASASGDIANLADQDWFSFTATSTGKITLTVDSTGDMTAKWLFTTNPSDAVYSGNSVTFSVVAGQTYSFGLATSTGLGHYAIGVKLAGDNGGCQVALVGTELRVTGTDNADVISLVVGSTFQLTVNGTTYQYARSLVKSITINGGAGSDSLIVKAATGSSTVVLQPNVLNLSGSGYKVYASCTEAITVRAGVGTSTATLYDSAGNDVFVAGSSYAQMSGSTFTNRVEGFSTVTAIASTGVDVATLHDSAGNDTLTVSSKESTLSGTGFSNRVRYFDEIHAVGDGGGYDKAMLYGLSASSTLTASGKKAALTLGGSSSTSIDFDRFEMLQALGTASKSAKLETSALDFILTVAGKRV